MDFRIVPLGDFWLSGSKPRNKLRIIRAVSIPLKPVPERFWCPAPEWIGAWLVTLMEYTVCRAEIIRAVPVSRLMHDQRPSWGIPLVPEPGRVSYGARSVIDFWPSWSAPICKASSSRPVKMTGLWPSWSMPSVGSGIYSSGNNGQPFNSHGAYHQNPCPEVYLFSV